MPNEVGKKIAENKIQFLSESREAYCLIQSGKQLYTKLARNNIIPSKLMRSKNIPGKQMALEGRNPCLKTFVRKAAHQK